MTDAAAPLSTADGRPLKAALAASQARARRRALALVAPLFLFVLITFVVPIGQMLFQSVYNPTFADAAPALRQWFDDNPPGAEIDETAFAALAADLRQMRADRTAGAAGTRINYDVAGTRSLFTAAARRADSLAPPTVRRSWIWTQPGATRFCGGPCARPPARSPPISTLPRWT